MEKELNIAAILKEKPKDTELYDIARNVTVLFQKIDKYENIICSLSNGQILKYTNTGRMYQFSTGMQVLFPSDDLQDWSKFTWKKGDVVANNKGYICMFLNWSNIPYSMFKCVYIYHKCNYGEDYIGEEKYFTDNFHKVSDDVAKKYLETIEEHYGGKLNLETLTIEQPKQEFKDGDIVFVKGEEGYEDYIEIFSHFNDGAIYDHASYNIKHKKLDYSGEYEIPGCEYQDIRLATNSEKQKLFSALEKKGKHWNPDTKQIEDLPKKCEFEPFQKVLVRDLEGEEWRPAFFRKEYPNDSEFVIIGGTIYSKCIPYNDQTKHLLGTTDEWKGGEG